MNSQPKHSTDYLQQHAGLVVLVFILITPLLVYSALGAIQNKTNQVADWLPESYSETEDLNWFREHFVSDQFVVVSWEGCRLGGDPRRFDSELDDPRIQKLANYLVGDIATETQRPSTESTEIRRYIKSVTTARQLLNQLTSEPIDLRYDWAVNRLKGSLIGYDGSQTCVVITLTDDAVVNLRSILSRGTGGWLQVAHPEGHLLAAIRDCGIDPEFAYFGGPPVDNVAIDEEGELTLYRLATLAAIAGLALAWLSLGSFRLTIIVFACGMMSAIASLSVVWITGGTTDSFLLAMPSLVYVLAISGAVHLVKYYRDEIHSHGLTAAPRLAIKLGWKPTLLCSVTTAIGLLALLTSDLTPVRKFGSYSAVGVMLMLVTLFVFLPAALQVWPLKTRERAPRSKRDGNEPDSNVRLTNLDKFWQHFGGWIIRHHWWVTVFCASVIGSVGWGVTRVHTNIDLMKLFDSEARIRADYQWLEKNVSRLVPVEIVLRFRKDSLRRNDETEIDWYRYDVLERMEAVSHVHRVIDAKFGSRGKDLTSRPISAITFAPPIPKDRKDIASYTKRSITNSGLESSYQSLIDGGYLAIDQETGDELWRVSVRVAAFKDIDYGQFTDRLREVVKPIIDYHNRKLNAALLNTSISSLPNEQTPTATSNTRHPEEPKETFLSVKFTGVIPIVYKAQRALLQSLIESTFWSFITITPLLMLVSRGFWAGLTATLPNSLPVLVVFGGMGWLGIPVTIGSMMSASIALGVAVDDTIHYLMWYRRNLNETGDRNAACLAAYRRCATPTLQAALISGFGLSVFAFSTFTPTEQFGMLMLAILLTGVVAELILLPALLAGPLGRTFVRKKSNDRKQ